MRQKQMTVCILCMLCISNLFCFSEKKLEKTYQVDATAGGLIEEPDGFSVTVQRGTLTNSSSITVMRNVSNPTSRRTLGDIVDISSSAKLLDRAIRIEMPIDRSRLKNGLKLENVYALAFRNDSWVEVPSCVDPKRKVIAFQTNHLCEFTWDADLDHFSPLGPFRDAFFKIAGYFFGPEPDPMYSVEFRRAEYDSFSDQILSRVRDKIPVVSKDAFVIGRLELDGRTLEIVPTSLKGLDGTSQLVAVRKPDGILVKDRDLIFRALYAWKARDRLSRMNRTKLAIELKYNAKLLRKMRRYHEAARAMDVAQQILSDLLAEGTIGKGKTNPLKYLKKYAGTALDQLVASIADMEIYRTATLFEETANELNIFDSKERDSHRISYLYTMVLDAAKRNELIRDFARETFPGYDENESLYTLKRIFKSFAGEIESNLSDSVMGTIKADLLESHAEKIRYLVRSGQFGLKTMEIANTTLGLLAALVGASRPLSDYYEGCQRQPGNFITWAESKLASRAVTGTREVQKETGKDNDSCDPTGAWNLLVQSNKKGIKPEKHRISIIRTDKDVLRFSGVLKPAKNPNPDFGTPKRHLSAKLERSGSRCVLVLNDNLSTPEINGYVEFVENFTCRLIVEGDKLQGKGQFFTEMAGDFEQHDIIISGERIGKYSPGSTSSELHLSREDHQRQAVAAIIELSNLAQSRNYHAFAKWIHPDGLVLGGVNDPSVPTRCGCFPVRLWRRDIGRKNLGPATYIGRTLKEIAFSFTKCNVTRSRDGNFVYGTKYDKRYFTMCGLAPGCSMWEDKYWAGTVNCMKSWSHGYETASCEPIVQFKPYNGRLKLSMIAGNRCCCRMPLKIINAGCSEEEVTNLKNLFYWTGYQHVLKGTAKNLRIANEVWYNKGYRDQAEAFVDSLLTGRVLRENIKEWIWGGGKFKILFALGSDNKARGLPKAKPRTIKTLSTRRLFFDDFEDRNDAGWTHSSWGPNTYNVAWTVIPKGNGYRYQGTGGNVNGGGNSVAYPVGFSGGADYIVEADITNAAQFHPSAGAGGLVVRYSNTMNFYACILTPTAVQIFKTISGKGSILNKARISFTVGDVAHIRFGIHGSSLICTVDGKTVITATDSSLSSGGFAILNWGGTKFFDNVKVNSVSK